MDGELEAGRGRVVPMRRGRARATGGRERLASARQRGMGVGADGASDEALAITAAAAKSVASRLQTYRAELLPQYVICFLENVLGAVLAGFLLQKQPQQPARAVTPAERLGLMLDFVQACLVPDSTLSPPR